jgi:hypothetical protein
MKGNKYEVEDGMEDGITSKKWVIFNAASAPGSFIMLILFHI